MHPTAEDPKGEADGVKARWGAAPPALRVLVQAVVAASVLLAVAAASNALTDDAESTDDAVVAVRDSNNDTPTVDTGPGDEPHERQDDVLEPEWEWEVTVTGATLTLQGDNIELEVSGQQRGREVTFLVALLPELPSNGTECRAALQQDLTQSPSRQDVTVHGTITPPGDTPPRVYVTGLEILGQDDDSDHELIDLGTLSEEGWPAELEDIIRYNTQAQAQPNIEKCAPLSTNARTDPDPTTTSSPRSPTTGSAPTSIPPNDGTSDPSQTGRSTTTDPTSDSTVQGPTTNTVEEQEQGPSERPDPEPLQTTVAPPRPPGQQ